MMKISRRTLGRVVVAAGLAGSIAAFPASAEDLPYGLKPGKPYAGTTLTYLAPVAAQYDGHAARVQEFTDMTGIEVEFDFIPFRNLQERILSHKVAGDSEPDLINYMDAWGPALKDMFAPIDDKLAADGISMSERYFAAHEAGATYDGSVYGLPLRGHAQLLFYRKDLLDKHGLDAPTTWTELVDVAKVIKAEEGLGIASYYTTKQAQNVAVWMNMVWGNGGELIRDGKIVFNSPEAAEALQFYSDLENVHGVNADGAKGFDQHEASLSVAAGNSAFFMGWWWHYGSRILGENTTLDAAQVGFTGMPAFKDESVTFAMSMPTAINVESDKQGAAWEFLKWVSNADLEKVNVTEKADRNVIVALHRANLTDADVNAANRGLQAAAANSLGSSRIFPQIAVWPEIMQIISNAISEVVVNGADPQEALDTAAVEAQKILDRG